MEMKGNPTLWVVLLNATMIAIGINSALGMSDKIPNDSVRVGDPGAQDQ